MNEFVIGNSGTRYRRIRQLGRGGFGIVYLVEDGAGNSYALKLIGPVQDPSVQETFEREINSVSDIKHEHILKVLDFGSSPTFSTRLTNRRFLVIDVSGRRVNTRGRVSKSL